MLTIKKRMIENPFLDSVITLISGTVFSQIVAMGLSPILTRVYSPEEYGTFSFYLTVVSLLTVVATGRYEMAIILPKKNSDAINLVFICIVIAILLSVLFVISGTVFRTGLNDIFNGKFLGEYLIVIPLSIAFTGFYQTFYFWSNRQMEYKAMSLSKVYQSLINTIGGIGLGFLRFGVIGLVLAQIFSLIVSTLYLLAKLTNLDLNLFKESISKEKIKANIYQYKDLPLYNSFHAFLDMGITSGTFFLISHYYGNTTLGLYSFTWRVLRSPMTIVGTAISQVYTQKASEYVQKGLNIAPLLLNITKKLTIIALPIFFVLLVFGKEIFRIIFGDRWESAGWITQVLVPWLFLNFVGSPITQTYVILNRQKTALVIAIFQTLLLLISIILVGSFHYSENILFITMSVIGSLTTILFGWWIFSIAKAGKSFYKERE